MASELNDIKLVP